MIGPKKISQFSLAEVLTNDDFVAGIKKVGTDAYENVKIPVSMLHGDFSSMFELVTPEVGNPYIKAKLDFMSVGEITAYAAGGVDNIWDNMPVATASTLGGIKVGESLIIEDGVLNINGDTFNLTNYYTKAQTDSLLSGKFDKTGGSITGDVSITGNLTITGLGKEFIADVQTVQIADNLAVINYGETGAGVTAGFSGWEIDRGTATYYRFGYSESPGYFQVGKVGDLQTVATREDVPLSNGFARWNATLKRFDTVAINNIVTGTGTAGYIPKFTGTSVLGDSVIYETGGNVLIGKTSVTSGYILDVNGAINIGSSSNTSSFKSTSQHYTVMFGDSTTTNLWEFKNTNTWKATRFYVEDANTIAGRKTFEFVGGAGANPIMTGFCTGEVAINKTSVTSGYMLDVNGAITADGVLKTYNHRIVASSVGGDRYIELNRGNGLYGTTRYRDWMIKANGATSIQFLANQNNNETKLVEISSAGDLFVSNSVAINKTTVTSGYILDVNGAIRAAGNIYATGNIEGAGEVTAYTASDARLKTNITSLNNINALDIINALNPVTYTWNSKAVQLNPNKNTTSINYGIIAQELEQIVPDLIRPIYGDYKTYDDRGLMTIMLQAIKELKAEVDLLKNKN